MKTTRELNKTLKALTSQVYLETLAEMEKEGFVLGALVKRTNYITDEYESDVYKISSIMPFCSNTSWSKGAVSVSFKGFKLRKDGTFGKHGHCLCGEIKLLSENEIQNLEVA